jgi:hypothetical protein
MEQLVGQPLLARTTRSLGLTETGRALAARARAVLEAADAARLVLRKEGDALQGRLRITTMRAFGHNVLAPLLADFGREHPCVAMELLFTERRVDLVRAAVARQLDIEAQLPGLETTLAEQTRQEAELQGFVAALLAKRREMETALAEFRRSRSLAKSERNGGFEVRFDTDRAEVTAAFDQPVPDGARVVAKVTDPRGAARDVTLDRVDDRTFRAEFAGGEVGTYGVGVTATGSGGEALTAISGTAELGYSREYAGEPTDTELLEALSGRTGGRGSITSAQAFDRADLPAGRRAVDLGWWLLLLAALLWPLTLAVSRLRRTSGPEAVVRLGALGSIGSAVEGLRGRRPERTGASVTLDAARSPGPPSVQPPAASPGVPPEAPAPPPAPSGPPSSAVGSTSPVSPERAPADGADSGSSLESLLEAKRHRRDGR